MASRQLVYYYPTYQIKLDTLLKIRLGKMSGQMDPIGQVYFRDLRKESTPISDSYAKSVYSVLVSYSITALMTSITLLPLIEIYHSTSFPPELLSTLRLPLHAVHAGQ